MGNVPSGPRFIPRLPYLPGDSEYPTPVVVSAGESKAKERAFVVENYAAGDRKDATFLEDVQFSLGPTGAF
jgi:hypothetical protein